MRPDASRAAPTAGRIVLAFALLYVIWGTSYLAIAIAVHDLPPLTVAAVRFLIAGAVMHALFRLQGEPALTPRQWCWSAVVGLLVLGAGNGLVCIAEQRVPSSVTALTLACTPVFMLLVGWAWGQTPRPRLLTWVGVVLGLLGVAWLVGAPSAPHAVADLVAFGLLLIASLSWSVGSVWSRVLPLPRSPLLASAAQSWTAGIALAIAAAARGEWHQASFLHASWLAVGCVLYLAFVATGVAFGSYVYLLRYLPPGVVSTYAFVNPLIAVLLGWAVHHEAVGGRIAIASGCIIPGVMLIIFTGLAAAKASARPSATCVRAGAREHSR